MEPAMTPVTYRELETIDAELFSTIDRSEVIDGRYTVVGGRLVLEPHYHVVTGWYPSEIVDHPAKIRHFISSGGSAFGAFAGSGLVGLAALDPSGVGGDASVMQLEPLHVSAGYRNRGIGKTLVADAARNLGATLIYISSIPTRNSVDAYLRMGARLASPPDPVLLAMEPEDIHLVLPIVEAVRTAE
jgi:ribosomal protein S18 acetylase RimI-like enzyme